MSGWIGVDFDATLVVHNSGNMLGPFTPVMPMVERIRGWLEQGVEVRIVTARAPYQDLVAPVEEFCIEYFRQKLTVTDKKDFAMIELWDDRAIQIIPNVGVKIEDSIDLAKLSASVKKARGF